MKKRMFVHSSVNRKHVQVHCAIGSPSLFPRSSWARETPRMEIGNEGGERKEGFKYPYSGLKLVLKLKYIGQLNKKVFSEQTRSWTFSVSMCRAHPFKMKSNCKCLQDWGLNASRKGQWDHRKTLDWCRWVSSPRSCELMCCWWQHRVHLCSGSVVFCTLFQPKPSIFRLWTLKRMLQNFLFSQIQKVDYLHPQIANLNLPGYLEK